MKNVVVNAITLYIVNVNVHIENKKLMMIIAIASYYSPIY